MINEIKADAKDRMTKSVESLKSQMSKIRTGRAQPALLDGISVEYYGSATPLRQVANVVAEDARTLAVTVFDRSMIQAVEKAIMTSDLGINPTNDGTTVRLLFPELTEDRRKELVKDVKKKGEAAKVAIRNIRRDGIDAAKKLKGTDVSEDEIKDMEDDLQKLTDKYVKEVDKAVESKSKEVMTV